METNQEIYFYGTKDDFSYMSNFYNVNFTDKDGIVYNCSEQYFMYQKCKTFEPENKTLLSEILTTKSATKIKSLGRKVKNYDDKIWANLRYNIMVDALYLKFCQNDIIRKELLETKDKYLYEASKNDKIWGIGFYSNDAIDIDKKRFGLNLLGKALMQVREKLQK